MRKANYTWLCYGATLAIVLAVALLPFSSWAFKNHLDILTGGWQSGGDLPEHWIYPNRLLRTYNAVPNLEEEQDKEQTHQKYLAAQKEAQDDPNDPAKLARLVAWDSAGPFGSNARGRALVAMPGNAVWAAERGMRIEPGNAFFPLMLAALSSTCERYDQVQPLLRRAATCQRYEDYSSKEAEDLYARLEKSSGYRGEKARAAVLGPAYPHVNRLRFLAREITYQDQTPGIVQAEADLVRVAQLMERSSKTLIGVLIATGIEERATHLPISMRKYGEGKHSATVYGQAFEERQSKAAIKYPVESALAGIETDRLRSAAFSDINARIDPVSAAFDFLSTALAPSFLLALVLSIAIAAFTSRSNSDLPRRLLPFVAGGTALTLVLVHSIRDANSDTSLTLLYCLPAVAFFAALVASRGRMAAPPGLVGGAVLVISLGIAGVATRIVLGNEADVWLAYGIVVGAVACVCLLGSASQAMIRVAPVVTLLLAVGYLGGVVREVRQNETIKATLDGYSLEADLLRARAGIR